VSFLYSSSIAERNNHTPPPGTFILHNSLRAGLLTSRLRRPTAVPQRRGKQSAIPGRCHAHEIVCANTDIALWDIARCKVPFVLLCPFLSVPKVPNCSSTGNISRVIFRLQSTCLAPQFISQPSQASAFSITRISDGLRTSGISPDSVSPKFQLSGNVLSPLEIDCGVKGERLLILRVAKYPTNDVMGR
jgi:hypothetical protein